MRVWPWPLASNELPTAQALLAEVAATEFSLLFCPGLGW
jgi:hypothetical protein